MGKKARKAQAKKAESRKTNEDRNEAGADADGDAPAGVGKQLELHDAVAGGTEFCAAATFFGIGGKHPDPREFKHPDRVISFLDVSGNQLLDTPVYKCAAVAIKEVWAESQKYENMED